MLEGDDKLASALRYVSEAKHWWVRGVWNTFLYRKKGDAVTRAETEGEVEQLLPNTSVQIGRTECN